MAEKLCEWCYEQVPKSRNRNAVYCSTACQIRAKAYRRLRRAGRALNRQIKVCAACGNEYASIQARQLYCGEMCRNAVAAARKRVKRTEALRQCVQCENYIVTTNPRRRFCSGRCISRAKYKRENATPAKRRIGARRRCVICKQQFSIKTALQKFCSHKCTVISRRVPTPESKCCGWCQTEFQPKSKRQRFCGRLCTYRFHETNRPPRKDSR